MPSDTKLKGTFTQHVKEFFQLYRDPRLFTLALIGFSSAIPLPLLGSTLTFWLAENGIHKAALGLFAIFHLPYSLKVLWGPVIDLVQIPYLSTRFGQRRAWALFSLLGTLLSFMAMANLDPAISLSLFPALILVASFFSGCLYMVGLAFEIESVETKLYAPGSASVIFGYRLGLLASGAGALYLAHYYTWSLAYCITASTMVLGIIAVIMSKEPKNASKVIQEKKASIHTLYDAFYDGVIYPFYEFIKRPNAWFIFLFLVFYKAGDDLSESMVRVFYLEIGFSKVELANATKIFGMIATFLGAFLAGYIVYRSDKLQCLFYFGLFHSISHVFYILQTLLGYNLDLLYLTVALEHVTGGMVMTAFISFLWGTTKTGYGASQYALLWSLVSIKKALFCTLGGLLATFLNWELFFCIVLASSIVGPTLSLFLQKSEKKHTVVS